MANESMAVEDRGVPVHERLNKLHKKIKEKLDKKREQESQLYKTNLHDEEPAKNPHRGLDISNALYGLAEERYARSANNK